MSPRTQFVHKISFTIPNDSTFEARHTKDGRRWASAMRKIKTQTGWVQTLWGRDMNAFHKLDLIVIWAHLEHAEAFQTTPSFEVILSQIAISALTISCIELEGELSSGGPTELITLFFPPLLEPSGFSLFSQQLQDFAHESSQLRLSGGPSSSTRVLSVSHGWIMGHIQRDSRMLKGYLVALQWGSLDEMYHAKQDQASVYNKFFVQLKDESTGSEPALYTSLTDYDAVRGRCVVM
ncbi:hypothetical protein MMC21_008154 [Puttea exsequens]|nr:hypothetical protein [Puttea exsequens]